MWSMRPQGCQQHCLRASCRTAVAAAPQPVRAFSFQGPQRRKAEKAGSLARQGIRGRGVCCAVQTGDAPNNAASFFPADASFHSREMFVADLDLTQDMPEDLQPNSSRISVPAHDSVTLDDDYHSNGHAYSSGETGLQIVRDNEELKAELTTVKQELAETTEEVQLLHGQLADKERTLQATKADLIETRLELQRTDDRLRDVQDRLVTATNERSEYRQYLLEAQHELQTTRAELLEWSEGLVELKGVMEGLDDDLAELFGNGNYSEAVSEAMSITESIGSGNRGLEEFAEGRSSAAIVESEQAESLAQALQGLQALSAEVLRQAEEDQKLLEDS